MSRLKRWTNMHKSVLNSDGTLKEEVRQQKLAQGRSEAAVSDYAARLKEEYERLKALDEIEPEPWFEYTAYDLFSEEEKEIFNTDGTLKPGYIKYARSLGLSEGYLEQLEYNKKRDVEDFDRMSEQWAARGMNFGEFQMRSRIFAVRNYNQNLKQMRHDLRNGEDIDSLALDVEPDDYYQQHFSSERLST